MGKVKEDERVWEGGHMHQGLRLQGWQEPDHERPCMPTRGFRIGSLGSRKSSEGH